MPTFTLPDNVRLHYEITGQGPVILFLPGLFCSSRFFQAQLDGLSDRFQVIALDYRGHGRSDHIEEPVAFNEAVAVFCTGLAADAGAG